MLDNLIDYWQPHQDIHLFPSYLFVAKIKKIIFDTIFQRLMEKIV